MRTKLGDQNIEPLTSRDSGTGWHSLNKEIIIIIFQGHHERQKKREIKTIPVDENYVEMFF